MAGKFDGIGWPDDVVAMANARHEKFMVIARDTMDHASNDPYRANGPLRRRFRTLLPDELSLHQHEAADMIYEVLRERGLPR